MAKHGTILLVENDTNDAFLIRRAFDDAGINNPVQVVSSGEEAFSYLDGESKYADREIYPIPFLILTDYKMPDGGAPDILRWLGERPDYRKKIIVLVLSSMCSEGQIDELYELGAKSVLLKPVTYAELVTIMRQVKEYWIDLTVHSAES
jgi:CheY-like chemotaxis protein